MRYIEVSRKITHSKSGSSEDVLQSLLMRLRQAFKINNLEETANRFKFSGTTGGQFGIVRHAQANIAVEIETDGAISRVYVFGHSSLAKSLLVSYSFLFLLVLLVGLLPGSIETDGENSGAIDALVFLIFGIFIYYDINKKLAEPKECLEAALQSLETEYG